MEFNGILTTEIARNWAEENFGNTKSSAWNINDLAFEYLERHEEITSKPFEVVMIWAGDEPEDYQDWVKVGKTTSERPRLARVVKDCYDYQLRKDNLLIQGFEKVNGIYVFAGSSVKSEVRICFGKKGFLLSLGRGNWITFTHLIDLFNRVKEYNRKYEAVEPLHIGIGGTPDEMTEIDNNYKQAQASIIRLDCSNLKNKITG